MTGRVTKGNHSLEIRSVLENNELLTTTLFLIFGIVYHPLKIAPAIRWNMLLHKCFGRYRLYVMAIHECLARLSQFVRHWVTYFVLRHATNIIKSKLSTWKKVILASALNPCNSFAAKCFNFVFSDQEVDNYKHRYELRFLLQE